VRSETSEELELRGFILHDRTRWNLRLRKCSTGWTLLGLFTGTASPFLAKFSIFFGRQNVND